jgi:hypothetical protein
MNHFFLLEENNGVLLHTHLWKHRRGERRKKRRKGRGKRKGEDGVIARKARRSKTSRAMSHFPVSIGQYSRYAGEIYRWPLAFNWPWVSIEAKFQESAASSQS